MNLRRRLPISTSMMVTMTLISGGSATAQGVPSPKDVHAWDALDREELLRYARATWHSFESMADPGGPPSDGLHRAEKGEWRPSKRTSPTDVAAYLWSTLAARSLDLIDDAETDRRLGASLATLGRMDRDQGFF